MPASVQLYNLKLPNHWLRDLFFAEASLELQLTDDALSYYTNLSLAGFEGSPYIQNQLALVYYNKKSKTQTWHCSLLVICPLCSDLSMTIFWAILFVS